MSETPRHHMSLTRNLGSGNKRSALDCPPNAAGEQGPPQKHVRIRPGTPDDIDGPTAIAASSSDGSGAEGSVSSRAANGIQPDFSADVVHSQGKDGTPPPAWGQNAMAASVEPAVGPEDDRQDPAEYGSPLPFGGGMDSTPEGSDAAYVAFGGGMESTPEGSDAGEQGPMDIDAPVAYGGGMESTPEGSEAGEQGVVPIDSTVASQGATAPQPEAPDSPPVESSDRRRSPRPLLGIGDIDSTDESDHSDSGGQFAGSLDDRRAPRCPRRKAGPNDACPSLNRDDTGTPPEESASPVSTPPHSPKPERARAPGEPWMASNGP
ncbi:hypothetical protein LXA43DRAFT_1065060 [Ganoderma leucocontextum]|nr:hypothetical protein LXA43DRAFT_1067294 [Ganoderma leucocontextum]KAI1786489.1 hypothetical protein LXA43DRAFT_1065060 [Ganoderma leucocontextum]